MPLYVLQIKVSEGLRGLAVDDAMNVVRRLSAPGQPVILHACVLWACVPISAPRHASSRQQASH